MEAEAFARNFFSITSNGKNEENNLTDHEEWLLREYAKLMKKESELKKREKMFESQKK